MKKTVILGATTNPARYAYIAAHRLQQAGVPFVPVGIKQGQVANQPILDLRQQPPVPNVHTITLYLGPHNQTQWYDYMIGLQPRRIIFNPGTENDQLVQLAQQHGIEPLEACTLVLLSVGNY